MFTAAHPRQDGDTDSEVDVYGQPLRAVRGVAHAGLALRNVRHADSRGRLWSDAGRWRARAVSGVERRTQRPSIEGGDRGRVP